MFFDNFFPFIVPPALTLMTCLFLASITIQAGRTQRDTQLFTLFCILQTIFYLDTTLLTLLADRETVLAISRVTHGIYVLIAPITITFIHRFLGIRNKLWLEKILLVIGIVYMPITQTRYYFSDVYQFFFGYIIKAGIALELYVAMGVCCSLYAIVLLWRSYVHADDTAHKIKIRYVFGGVILNLMLIILNAYLPASGFEIYPPANFGFIPMGMMAYGVLHHKLIDTTKSWLTRGYISRIFVGMIWSPLLMAIGFWYFNGAAFHKNMLTRSLPYSIPPLLSFLTCLLLATLCVLKGSRRLKTILFGCICTLWGWLYLDSTLLMLIKDKSLALSISRMDHFFMVNNLGLYAHLIFLMLNLNRGRELVYLLYGIGLIFIPVTQTQYYFKGIHEFSWGLYAQKGIGFDIFLYGDGVVFLVLGIIILRAVKHESNRSERNQQIFFLIGGMLVVLLNFFSIPILDGRDYYPPGYFTFIPILLMAYGIFRHDILQMNRYTKNRFIGDVFKAALWIGFGGVVLGVILLVGDLPVDAMLLKIKLIGLPAFFSVIICFLLCLMALNLGQYQKESFVFSLICFLYALLPLDFLLNAVLQDAHTALIVSRTIHFFSILLLGLNLHMIYLVLERRQTKWVVYLGYGMGIFGAPLALTDYYFKGIRHNPFGFFFGDKGSLYDLYILIWLVSMIHILCIACNAFHQASDRYQKHRIGYTVFGLAGASVLSVAGNLPVHAGYNSYPMGNFIFVPFIMFAYGLLKHYFNEGLNIIRGLLYWALFLPLIWVGSMIIGNMIKADTRTLICFLAVVVSIFLYLAVKTGLNAFLDLFFGAQRERLRKDYENLMIRLSKTQPLLQIFKEIKACVFRDLQSQSYAMLWYSQFWERYLGWEAYNPQPGFFMKGKHIRGFENPIELNTDHPLLDFIQKAGQPIRQEDIEEYILTSDLSMAANDRFRESALIQPVFFEQKMTCLLLLGPKIDRDVYHRGECNFIHRLGLSLGPYIENAMLLQRLEQKVDMRTRDLLSVQRRLLKMNQIARDVSKTLDLKEAARSFIQKTVQAIRPEGAGAILLYDRGTKQFSFFAGYGLDGRFAATLEDEITPDSIFYHVFTSQKADIFNTAPADTLASPGKPQLHFGKKIVQYLVAPLVTRGTSMGLVIISIYSLYNLFNENDREFISNIAKTISHHFENAALFAETKAKESEISQINEVMKTVNSTLDLDEIIQTVMEALKRIFSFDALSIQLIDEANGLLKVHKIYSEIITPTMLAKIKSVEVPMDSRSSLTVDVVRMNRTLYFTDIKKNSPKFNADKKIHEVFPFVSLLSLPLIVQNRTIGCIGFYGTVVPFELKISDIQTIERYVTQVATAINNAKLYEEGVHKQEIITQQNRILHALFETTALIPQAKDLDHIFEISLNSLDQLFDDCQFGIVLNGEREDIIRCAVFTGMNNEKQQFLIENNMHLLNWDTHYKGKKHSNNNKVVSFSSSILSRLFDHLTVLPMTTHQRKVIGKLIIDGPEMEQQALDIIGIFLEQVTAVAINQILTKELEKMALTDVFTGVFNRAYFEEELTKTILSVKKFPNIRFSIILVDINGLKRVNDLFGHHSGDAMILKTAELLKAVARKSDVVARLGGDEFVLLCHGADFEKVRTVVQRIRQKEKYLEMLCKHADETEEIVPIRLSIGMATSENIAPDEVIKEADKAMYVDKQAFYKTRQRYR